jgi:hypothetical protein
MTKKNSTNLFLCKFIYNIHKWDLIQCEFKSAFIKSLIKIFLLCKIYVQFLKNYIYIFPQHDYVQFILKTFVMLFKFLSPISSFTHICL